MFLLRTERKQSIIALSSKYKILLYNFDNSQIIDTINLSFKKINFIKLALLASVGIKKIDIYSPLKVGVISTGDELIDYKKKKKDHQTFDSNKLQIINFLKKYPISIDDLGILKDSFKDVEKFYKTNKSKYDNISYI